MSKKGKSGGRRRALLSGAKHVTLMRSVFPLDMKDLWLLFGAVHNIIVRGTLGPSGIGPSIHLVICKEVRIALLFEP